MEKSTIIVFSVIAMISFCFAFSVYIYIASAMDSNMRRLSEGYAENSVRVGMARSDEELAFVGSFCTINVTDSEKFPENNYSVYLYKIKNCSIDKINAFESGIKSYNEAIMYTSLTASLAMHDMAEDRVSVIHERYPKENLLFVEKIHDIMGMLFTVEFSGLSWTQINGIFFKCQEGAGANVTTDMDCIKSLFDAEGKSTPVLMSKINFQGFKERCQPYFSKDKIAAIYLLNPNDACLRLEEISKELYAKFSSGSGQETVNGKFFKASVFYYLSNIDKDPQEVSNEINSIIRDNIAPEYREKFS